ncbi:hypothetical protein DFH06DRAFT_1089007 [Mycena polygramma]|nr:hypothetical protein DFH06DRAFT_1089007 [Mycena polygramma]
MDLTEDSPQFNPSLFIGVHKKFPSADADDLGSQGARKALAEVLAVPSDVHYLPDDDLPILDFLAMDFPSQSGTFVLSKPRSWYSHDLPTTDISCLLGREIPSKEFLLRLEQEAGQAWFDGCKSILDPRYNDGRDRFPLWGLGFWKEMRRLRDAHWTWETSVGWVDSQLEKDTLPDQDREALMVTKLLFKTMGWNTKISGQWTHLHLAKILSWQWLSDDHIDMLMTDLSARVAADPELAKTVLIAPLAFSEALKRASNKNYTKEDAPLLARYEAHIKEHGFKHLYFPSHVNKNHWIAGRIDFEGRRIGTGNPAPTELAKAAKRWTKSQFGGVDFTYQGDSMDHGEQKDTTSCTIIVANTIAADIFSEEIWQQEHAAGARADCFLRLTHSPAIRQHIDSPHLQRIFIPPKPSAQPRIHEDAPAEVNIAVALGDHNFPDLAEFVADVRVRARGPSLMDLLNPVADRPPTPGEDLEMPDVASELGVVGYTGDHGDVPVEDVDDDEMDVDSPAPIQTRVDGDGDSGDNVPVPAKSKKTLAEKRAKKANGTGTSKSALGTKADLDAYKSGALTPKTADPVKLARWKKKLEAGDPKVQYHPTDLLQVKHSVCGEYVRMGNPYQAAKWNHHLSSGCPVLHPENRKTEGKGRQGLAGVPSLFAWVGAQKAVPRKRRDLPSTEPCPGLTSADSPYLPGYLQRTGALGGGGRSLTAIAKEKFGKFFASLTAKKKKTVSDAQLHEHQWRNDHANLRVFSTCCKHEVVSASPGSRPLPCSECSSLLGLKNFKQAIRRPAPDDKNYIYVNKKYRNQLLGHIYARSIGLKEIIETSDAKNTPCIKFAQGTLQGKYTEFAVFEDLVEAMVMKVDKLERGVGMQNFKYPPAWDELCHIVQIQSPRAARALAEHFPVRTQRSFRAKEAREPRFPMDIGDRTFQLVEDYLATLDYHGPVNLSCDDTKLFPGLHLYHDGKEGADYLVGAVDGPIRVADPAAMKAVLADAKVMKATKVRVWCLTVPLPGLTPLVVAAMPIPNDMKAEQLLVPLEKILFGLLERNIRVVSYACDGTEVERSVQRMLVAKAERTITHTIPSPIPGAPDFIIVIGFFHGVPVIMIQDSKHGLKTFRNNLFTGARMLTFGNFTAIFRRIYRMAMDRNAPVYKRDVERLDRQDDPAATRLFCAETLAFLSQNFPEDVGEIVYLFVFGELVDAYQNREISHAERVKMVLRARYFLDAWARFLDVAGYKQSQYFLSREAVDIARILIEGLHTFGNSRKIVKDFTMLDFVYMIPKLRITMRQAVLAAKSSDPKARAEGYSHTYYDNRGANLLTLAVYPSDAEIKVAAELAAAESNTLVSLLGLVPEQLFRKQPAPLPSISAWYIDDDDQQDRDEDFDDVEEDRPSEAELLQALIDEQEREDAPSYGPRVTREIMSLTCASIAVSTDEHMRVYASILMWCAQLLT